MAVWQYGFISFWPLSILGCVTRLRSPSSTARLAPSLTTGSWALVLVPLALRGRDDIIRLFLSLYRRRFKSPPSHSRLIRLGLSGSCTFPTGTDRLRPIAGVPK
ncbi:hypothetical protein F5Y11DRAFT_276899 [Daldinia sp. FL1419]|nr:hypothetical protein F5Y11DRAFT_276899 [Daldinia sp. FL1419]